jgi:hypothetical protein
MENPTNVINKETMMPVPNAVKRNYKSDWLNLRVSKELNAPGFPSSKSTAMHVFISVARRSVKIKAIDDIFEKVQNKNEDDKSLVCD